MPASAGTTDVFDKGLNYILNNADYITLLTGEPSNYSDADTFVSNGGKKLGEVPITASELTLQGDGAGGREIIVPKRGYVVPDTESAGQVTYLALVDRSGSTLLVYTEHDDGAGNPVSVQPELAYNVASTNITIEDFTTS